MPAAPAPRRLPLLATALGVAMLVAVLGAVSVVQKVATFQPLGFAAQVTAGSWQVTEVHEGATGLQVGDLIVLVQGNAPVSTADLADRLRAQPASQLLVARADQLTELTYQRPGLDFDFSYLILALTAAAYLFIGLYALVQNRRRPVGLFFSWCAASATVYLFTYVPGPNPDALTRGIFGLEELARLLLPPLTLHLFLLFPTEILRPAARRWVAFAYLPAACVATLQTDLMFAGGGWFFGGRVEGAAIRSLDRIELILLVVFSLAALGVLIGQLLRHRHWEQRRQVQWIAAGLGVGYLPFVLLYAVPWSLGLAWPAWTTVAAVLPLSLVPLTFCWALLRYRLWDIEVMLRRAASYSVTLLLAAVAFSLVHLAIGRGLPEDQRLARNLMTFAAGLLIAGVLVPAERGVRSGLERFQSRRSYRQRRALARLGRELLEERDLPVLRHRLLGQMEESLGLERLELYLDHGQGSLIAMGRHSDSPPAIDRAVLTAEMADRPWWRLSGGALPAPTPSPFELLHERGFRYAFPLAVRHRVIGLFAAGFKLDGEPLNSEELSLVRSLLDQTALAIENAQLMEALRQQLDEVTQLKKTREQILESSPAGIVVLDRQGRIVDANLAFARLLDDELENLVGQPAGELLPIHPLPRPEDGLRETSFCDAQRRERHLQLSTAPFAGDADLTVLVIAEVTERVEMEHALQEKERLASLGMLAAGVAHEVNTPITGISSYAQMLLAETPEGDPRRELLEKVERQTFRASRIVHDLLEFARDRPRKPVVVSLERVLEEALEALDEKLRPQPIEVVWERQAGAPLQVPGHEGELQQVFTNLIANAIDAIGSEGGRLTLRLETEGTNARVSVEDDGPGIASDELDRIFQPFYSTKLATGGTGLGLSISYQIARRNGGRLWAESTLGQGSRFVVELPTDGHEDEATAS